VAALILEPPHQLIHGLPQTGAHKNIQGFGGCLLGNRQSHQKNQSVYKDA
jgi:hypothetical protein